jgi:cytochrome c-type protein NapC
VSRITITLLLCEREINRMRSNDSQECRNCHDVGRMDFAAQERAVRRYHRAMAQREKTCIDCHIGTAHPVEADEARALAQLAESRCTIGDQSPEPG